MGGGKLDGLTASVCTLIPDINHLHFIELKRFKF
jgi:hypothetical protein